MKKLFILWALLSSPAWSRVIPDDQAWMNFNTFITLTEKWQFYLEAQPRFVSHRDYLGPTLYRGALGYKVTEQWSVWGGYGFIEYSYPRDFYEDRPFLQLMYTHAHTTFKFTHRLRQEARYLEGRTLPSHRTRYLARAQWRLPLDLPLAAVVWNEWFWNGNTIRSGGSTPSPAPREGFDQNRFFVGLGYVFGENEKNIFELGYMNQYVNGKVSDQRNHVLAGQLTVRF